MTFVHGIFRLFCVLYYFALTVTVVNGLSKPDCTNESMSCVIIHESVLSITFVN